jgi:hypothetical protein
VRAEPFLNLLRRPWVPTPTHYPQIRKRFVECARWPWIESEDEPAARYKSSANTLERRGYHSLPSNPAWEKMAEWLNIGFRSGASSWDAAGRLVEHFLEAAFLVRTYSQKRPLVAARAHPSTAGWRTPSVLYCHTYWSSAQSLKRKYQSTPWRSDYGQKRLKHGPRSMSQLKYAPG